MFIIQAWKEAKFTNLYGFVLGLVYDMASMVKESHFLPLVHVVKRVPLWVAGC